MNGQHDTGGIAKIRNSLATKVNTLTEVQKIGHRTLLVEALTNLVVTALIGLSIKPNGMTICRDIV